MHGDIEGEWVFRIDFRKKKKQATKKKGRIMACFGLFLIADCFNELQT